MCASSLFVMQIKWTILKVEVKYNDKAVVASYRLQILRHVLLQKDENAISLPVSGRRRYTQMPCPDRSEY